MVKNDKQQRTDSWRERERRCQKNDRWCPGGCQKKNDKQSSQQMREGGKSRVSADFNLFENKKRWKKERRKKRKARTPERKRRGQRRWREEEKSKSNQSKKNDTSWFSFLVFFHQSSSFIHETNKQANKATEPIPRGFSCSVAHDEGEEMSMCLRRTFRASSCVSR